MKIVLPPGPVRYQWLGVRLFFEVWPDLRDWGFRSLWLAMKNVREHPGFQGWSGKMQVGSQNPTIYHRPKLFFDL